MAASSFHPKIVLGGIFNSSVVLARLRWYGNIWSTKTVAGLIKLLT